MDEVSQIKDSKVQQESGTTANHGYNFEWNDHLLDSAFSPFFDSHNDSIFNDELFEMVPHRDKLQQMTTVGDETVEKIIPIGDENIKKNDLKDAVLINDNSDSKQFDNYDLKEIEKDVEIQYQYFDSPSINNDIEIDQHKNAITEKHLQIDYKNNFSQSENSSNSFQPPDFLACLKDSENVIKVNVSAESLNTRSVNSDNEVDEFVLMYMSQFRAYLNSLDEKNKASSHDIYLSSHFKSCVTVSCNMPFCTKFRQIYDHISICQEDACEDCEKAIIAAQSMSSTIIESYESNKVMIEKDKTPIGQFFVYISKSLIHKNSSHNGLQILKPFQQKLLETSMKQSVKFTEKENEHENIIIEEKEYNPNEIYKMFSNVIQTLLSCPESIFFIEPVDPIKLNIPDYFDIIREPMDLGTVSRKLDERLYKSPWDVIYDVNLVFDNAYLYNKKSTRVHKCAQKLSQKFESVSDPLMKSLGYCCNRRYVHSLKTLYCNSNDYCVIRPNTEYYYHKDAIFCCACFNNFSGDIILCNFDYFTESISIPKAEFIKERNNRIKYEPFIICSGCHKKFHKICVQHVDVIDGIFYYCNPCFSQFKIPRIINHFVSSNLPRTKLSDFIELRINKFLKSEFKDCQHVNIRVILNAEKFIETKEGFIRKFGHSFHKKFPYKSKAIFAFQQLSDQEICFFSLHAHEYGPNCPEPNRRRVNISYLDSVHYFQPKHLKTILYHEILLAYMLYCKNKGFLYCHIWSCPPCEGDDYVFHCHSFEQKLPKPRRLLEWYSKMIELSLQRGTVIEYQDIYKYFCNAKDAELALQVPYFEGDYWSNSLDDIISEYESELKSLHQTTAKKHDINRKSSRKSISSPKRPEEYTLNQKIISLMDRYREMFFILKLNPDSIPIIDEPEPIFSSELMDGRSQFLSVCRDNNWEFSSLRHTLYSTKATMYIVHQQMYNFTEFTCDICKAVLFEGYHCNKCSNSYDLCSICLFRFGHVHSTVFKKYIDFNIEQTLQECVNMNQFTNVINMDQINNPKFKKAFDNFVRVLAHASECVLDVCIPGCSQLKQIIKHFEHCSEADRSKCFICSQLFSLYYIHASQCTNSKCPVPYCHRLKNATHHKESRSSKTRSRINNMAEQLKSLSGTNVSSVQEIAHDRRPEKNVSTNSHNQLIIRSSQSSDIQVADNKTQYSSPIRTSSLRNIYNSNTNSVHPYAKPQSDLSHIQIRSLSRSSRNANSNNDFIQLQNDSIARNTPKQSNIFVSPNTPSSLQSSTNQLELLTPEHMIQRQNSVIPQNFNPINQLELANAIRLGMIPRSMAPVQTPVMIPQGLSLQHQQAYVQQMSQIQNMRMVNLIQQSRNTNNTPNINTNMMQQPNRVMQGNMPRQMIQMNMDLNRLPSNALVPNLNMHQNVESPSMLPNMVINPRMLMQNSGNIQQFNQNQQFNMGDHSINMNGNFLLANANNIHLSQLNALANQQALLMQQLNNCNQVSQSFNSSQALPELNSTWVNNVSTVPNLTMSSQSNFNNLNIPMNQLNSPNTSQQQGNANFQTNFRPNSTIIPPGFDSNEYIERSNPNKNTGYFSNSGNT